MFKILSSWFGLLLCTLGYFYTINRPAFAQVTSDDTVNTQVTEKGKTAEITGGETRGDNLFHSFQDFSVKTGNEAFFNNADSISNIFSRVTGGNVSDIDGAIRANGSANLFLINPAGIIFGENASLNIGGSFYGSSASSILFEDGEFSAANLDNPPLLTVNAPIGLGFRDQPGDIVNRASTGDGLEVGVGENIALIGGNVSIEKGGIVFAPEGRIELGGLTESGIIDFTKDNNLSFPDAIARGDVSLTDSAIVAVDASAGDMAQGQAGNIEINTGSLTVNGSSLSAIGIGGTQDRGGNVTIDATKDVSFANGSNVLVSGAPGGSINIDAKNLSITSGSNFFNGIDKDSGFAEAQSGYININATDKVVVDGQGSKLTAINNSVDENAIGNAGKISISARNISLNNGGVINSFVAGQGNSSDITLNARENISINGTNDSYNSSVNSFIQASGEGNSGTTSLTAQNLTLSNGGSITSSVIGVGDSGDININVQDALTVDGEAIFTNKKIPSFSKISSNLGFDAKGNSGDINITATKLSLTNGGGINTNTYGIGNSGNIDINSTESTTVDGVGTLEGSSSGIKSEVVSGKGNAGNIEIKTSRLSLTNGARIDANTNGIGNAGNIDINATESININSTESTTTDELGTIQNFSGINSVVSLNAEGNGGNIQISTGDFTISNYAGVDASTSGKGNGGEIIIAANNLSLTNGGDLTANTLAAGDILTQEAADRLGIDADYIAQGNGGNITINVADTISIDGTSTVDNTGLVELPEKITESSSGIFASNAGNSIGNAGNIDVTAGKLSLTNGGQIVSFSNGKGNAGNITLDAKNSIVLDAVNESEAVTGISAELAENGVGNGGEININTSNLSIFGAEIRNTTKGKGDAGNTTINAQDLIFLRNNSSISTEAANNANGGNLSIDSNLIVAFPNQNNDIIANAAQGNGGNIAINAESILGIEERPLNKFTSDINASSEVTGFDGTININTSDINPLQGATELPSNVVEAQQTADQTCSANREGKTNNGLAIAGKGGISPTPDAPLSSENINNENSAQASIPQPLETSRGKIQPARGIKVTKSGKIVLTAYRTDNAGERIPEAKINCGQR